MRCPRQNGLKQGRGDRGRQRVREAVTRRGAGAWHGISPLSRVIAARGAVRAPGYRPDYRWLNVPVLTHKGELRHDGGVVTEAPGMYVLGLPVLRRRKSTFINGAEADTRDLAQHLAGYLAGSNA